MTSHDPDAHDDLETLARLDAALPRVTPPADMFDRILADVRNEAVVVPITRATNRRWAVPLAAAVGIAAAVAIAVGVALDGGDAVSARAVISGASDPAVGGEATLTDSAVRVSLRSVPEPPVGHHYEVWVLPEGSTEMISLGTFDRAGDVELEFVRPTADTVSAVDVSLEADDGPPGHSDTSLANGAFA